MARRNPRPSVVDCVTMIASVSGDPVRVKRRHATDTTPVLGSMAMVAPWLSDPSFALSRSGGLHRTPQSADDVNMMSERSVAPSPVKDVYAT